MHLPFTVPSYTAGNATCKEQKKQAEEYYTISHVHLRKLVFSEFRVIYHKKEISARRDLSDLFPVIGIR